MSRSFARDQRGRFAAISGVRATRKSRKANKLQAKNARVSARYQADTALHGTPLGGQIERGIARRSAKVKRLKAY